MKGKIKKIFNDFQISDIVVKYIIEKIISNVYGKLYRQKINNILPSICISNMINELEISIQQFFMCREIDPILIKNNPKIFYDRAFTDNEPINEIEVVQPKSSKMDRWKIYRIPIVKMNDLNTNRIEEDPLLEEEKRKKKKIMKYKPYKKYIIFKEKKEREEEDKKKNKNKIIDLPSYPIEDLEKKANKNMIYRFEKKSKSDILDYQELNQYYLNKIKLEEENKQKELDKKLNIINSIKSIKEPKKIYENYKGKNINVDHNGKIVLIKEIKIENLKNDFVGLNSKINNDKYKKRISPKSIKIQKINIENHKIEGVKNNSEKIIEYNINNNKNNNLNYNQLGKTKIISGSPFDHFYPEVGVAIKEGNEKKDGGLDFYKKYKKFDMIKFNNTMIDINKELNYKTRNQNSSINDFINSSNIINNSNNINGDNLNNQSLYKTMYKSISLPNINSSIKNAKNKEYMNNNEKIINKNNSISIKGNNHSLYIKNYLIQNDIENNYIKYGKYIKANDSFKQILLKKDDDDASYNRNKSNDYINDIYYNNKKRKIEGYNSIEKYKYNEVNNFNKTIVRNNNWGKDSLLNNKIYNTKNYWYKNRFFYNKKINPYSTIRIREKNKKIQNTTNFFNTSENEYVKKYLNKSNNK